MDIRQRNTHGARRARGGFGPRAIAGLLATAGLLSGLAIGGTAHAAEPVKTYWYDGSVRRELWIDPQTRAIVPAPAASGAEAATGASAASAPAKADKRPAGATGPAPAAPNLVQRKGGQPASDGGSTASTASTTATPIDSALSGGIVVTLREPLPDAQARAFLQARGLAPRREIGKGSGAWLVDSPAGLETLERANRLYESGAFAGAQPNWHRPLVTK
ncbi:MAG: hypothetical protein QM674_20735 [Burkholderiaceae bacterium]